MAATETRPRKDQVAWELSRRPQLGVMALASGVLFLISGVIQSTTLRGAPTTSLVQGLGPALRGDPNPAVSPRAVEVRYISHHAFGLIAGSVLAALSVLLAVAALRFLYQAARYRRPESTPVAQPLLLAGGIAYAAISVISQIITAIDTHKFATGHDFSNHAVDQALSTGTGRVVAAYAGLLTALALAGAIVAVSLNAMRSGLLTRFMGILGCIVALLFVLPLGPALPIVQALWLVGLGVLMMGRWPSGDPPAWEAGEARPWPSGAELREQRAAAAQAGRAQRGGRPQRGAAAADAGAAAADAPPEPSVPERSASRRKRKRGSRR